MLVPALVIGFALLYEWNKNRATPTTEQAAPPAVSSGTRFTSGRVAMTVIPGSEPPQRFVGPFTGVDGLSVAPDTPVPQNWRSGGVMYGGYTTINGPLQPSYIGNLRNPVLQALLRRGANVQNSPGDTIPVPSGAVDTNAPTDAATLPLQVPIQRPPNGIYCMSGAPTPPNITGEAMYTPPSLQLGPINIPPGEAMYTPPGNTLQPGGIISSPMLYVPPTVDASASPVTQGDISPSLNMVLNRSI